MCKIEKVWCSVVRFEHGEIFGVQMRIVFLASEDRKEKPQVRVVRVQQIELSEVLRIVAGHRGKVRVELL